MVRLKHWSRAERPIAQVPRACHAHGAEKASRQEAPRDSSAPGNVPGARARVPRPLSLCLPGPLTLHLPFCGPLTGLFCSRRSVGCESGPRRPPPLGATPALSCRTRVPAQTGVGAPPQPLSPLSGPLLLSATATVLFLRPANTGLEHGSAFPPCYQLSRRSTQRATGGEPTLLGPALCREKRAVSAAHGVLSTVEALGCRAGVYFAPRPCHRVPCASVAHPHSTKGPQGSPILTPGCKLRKQIAKVWGLSGKHPMAGQCRALVLLQSGRAPVAGRGFSTAEMPPGCVVQGQGGVGSWSVTAAAETPPGRGDGDRTTGPWNHWLTDSGLPGATGKKHIELVPAGLTWCLWTRGLGVGQDPRGLCPRGSAGRAELTPAMDDPSTGRTDWERQAAKSRVCREKCLNFMFG